jgi:hypothetical protein
MSEIQSCPMCGEPVFDNGGYAEGAGYHPICFDIAVANLSAELEAAAKDMNPPVRLAP